jgi:hypothetical protein
MQNSTVQQFTSDLSNWKPASKLHLHFPELELTPSKVKHLLWQRDKRVGLSSCCNKIGNRMYVCVPLFGLWLGGQLPEQQVEG